MDQEPAIIGRAAAAREVTAEPPVEIPRYPGKPLAHRFFPTQQPRLVEEPVLPAQSRLASSTPFKPIAAFSYPDKNVYLGPVSNVRTRGLQPVAIAGAVSPPVPESQPFEVSEELRGPLEARINRLATPTQVVTPLEETAVQPTPITETSPPALGPLAPPTTLSELERLKAAAIEELAKRGTQIPDLKEGPALPTQPIAQRTGVTPPETAVILPKLAGETTSIRPPQNDLAQISDKPEDKTRELISEAERLEDELTETLKGITADKEGLKTAATKREKEDEYLAQISQLVADRTELLKKVNDLSNASKEDQARRVEAETKLAESTKEFNRQIQELRIERTNLAQQSKTLAQKIEDLEKKQALVKEASNQAIDLKNQLTAATKEREDSREQVRKLQSFLAELQKIPSREGPSLKRSSAPQVVERPKEEEPAVRIVKPQAAVGKMAPVLTSTPNVINGIVKDTAGYLLSNTIIVVKDKAGEPVRALKTNKIGQFAISTPLPNDTYTMEVEAEGHNFDVVQVELEGKVLPPLEIRATD